MIASHEIMQKHNNARRQPKTKGERGSGMSLDILSNNDAGCPWSYFGDLRTEILALLSFVSKPCVVVYCATKLKLKTVL